MKKDIETVTLRAGPPPISGSRKLPNDLLLPENEQLELG
jgi:hypothetical protein